MYVGLAIALLIVSFLWFLLKKPSNYPPGPWGLPFIGYIPMGLKQYEVKLRELNKKHGDIVSWRVGSQIVVFLFNYDTVKELMSSHVLANRPDSRLIIYMEDNSKNQGLISSNGAHWNSMRRFTLRHLRDMGMGKSKLISAVQYEADEFVADLKNYTGRPINIPKSLTISILNVIWQLVAGKRYNFQDEEILDIDRKIGAFQRDMPYIMLDDFFPWFKNIIPKSLLYKLLKKQSLFELSKTMRENFRKLIEEHKATIDENNPRDYIDMYLLEMEKQSSDQNSTMSVEDLIYCIADLFEGGTETTNGTIHFAILYMATHQEVQRKLQTEIDNAVAGSSIASLEEKSKLVYTNAFIHEVLRYSALAKNGTPHMTFSDIKVDDFIIPKGAIVLSPNQFVHFDSRYFENPREFRPERFLSPTGEFVFPKEGFIAFGTGKRKCMGESLSQMELLIFLTTLIRNFHFDEPQGMKIDLEPTVNPFLSLPKPNKILITTR